MSDQRDSGADSVLSKFNIEAALAPHPPRTNINTFYVDDRYAVRIARVRDTFPAHRHSEGDEGWFVHRGRLRIDTELGSIELAAGEGARIPRGVRHSPTALAEDTLVLVVNVRGLSIGYVSPEDEAASAFVEFDAAADPGETDPVETNARDDNRAVPSRR